jgi:hypothetical protein
MAAWQPCGAHDSAKHGAYGSASRSRRGGVGWAPGNPQGTAALSASGAAQTREDTGRAGVCRVGRMEVGPEILGYGSSGTLVFEGTLDGRPIAVKRLLRQARPGRPGAGCHPSASDAGLPPCVAWAMTAALDKACCARRIRSLL